MTESNSSGIAARPAFGFPADGHPMVSVIVPCRNEIDYLCRFAEVLLSQDYPSQRLEVIIADGMSNDGTRELLGEISLKYRHIYVIDNPKQIVPTGLNKAIAAARGDIIIRMDVHTEYASDYVTQCVETLLKTGAGNVGGPARTKAMTFLQKAIAAAYHSRFAVGTASFHFENIEGSVDTAVYGCWRKETLLKIGLFDEDLVRNQDDELNFRLKRAGLKIWQNPAIRSWYYPRSSLKDLFKQYFQYGFWKFMVIRKHGYPASWRHLVPGIFTLTLFLLVLLAPLLPSVIGILQIVVSSYMLFLLIGSIFASCKSGWARLPVLPFVLSTFHLSYGLGFLYAVLMHLLGLFGRKRSTASITGLSR